MLSKFWIAVSLVVVFGATSAAMAKHPAHHRGMAVEGQVPATGYQAFGYAGRNVSVPAYMRIQDQDWINQVGR
jgi:hypothetical protein